MMVMMANAQGPFYEALGVNVHRARQVAGLSQDMLARLVGLSRTSITNIEKGRQPVDVHVLVRVAEVLHTDLSKLLPPSPADVAEAMPALDTLPSETRAWVQDMLRDIHL